MKMTNDEFYQWALEIFDKIEGTDEFKSVDKKINKYFYHMVIKCKRNFMAIHKMFEGEWHNSFIESIPLIRTLAEAYFHFCYIIDQKDLDKIVTDYNSLAEAQSYKVAKNLKELGTNLLPEEEEFIRQHLEGKAKPKPPTYLDQIKQLAIKTSNEYIYTRIYTLFSSYVHFNPATSVLYGTNQEEKFVFNSFEENETLYEALRTQTNGIIILLFTKIIDYLNIESLMEEFYKYYDEKDKIFKF